ncbi:adenine deaminase [Marininema halotolerans]|uniref:Adenine deaminase n=1 Tax=Marininema halotolerans TaxID=1155944 RepID=A0A1I6S7A2_9BACL|nr:adenine deaminase [Marininema halotolerans]SFS72845.1 adenine deaminase [Marininema halotolerans]
MERHQLQRHIHVASGKEPADLVIKNGQLVDVFNGQLISGDIAICNGSFVGIGSYEGKEVLDAKGMTIVPGLIDGHAHIESAMVTPEIFAKAVVPHGVTTLIADPHEIANVAGIDGIDYMLNASEGLPLDIYYMLPSSVPATPWEKNGAQLDAKALAPLYQHPRILGLGEVMDYPSVRDGSPEMIDKLIDAMHQPIPQIDGHAAGLDETGINIYLTAHIRTDHECVTADEARTRLERGMYLMIREGSVAKNMNALLPVVNERNARRCLFVTDDKHLDDLEAEGSVNYCVKEAIRQGLDPITAIQMVTLNAAECFGLRKKGAIAPGYDADFLLVDGIDTFAIERVFKSGKCVAHQGQPLKDAYPTHSYKTPPSLLQTVRLPEFTSEQLQLPMKNSQARVIGIIEDSLVTDHVITSPPTIKGYFQPSTTQDLLKLAVVERHQASGRIGLAIVKGLGLNKGALASTVAHDSHNLVLAGVDDLSMLTAARAVKEVGGGLAVADGDRVLACLPLPIAGLISNGSAKDLLTGLDTITKALEEVGTTLSNPFLSLSFLTLPVIPRLKLTDGGLFDVEAFRFVDVGIDE